MKKSSTTNEIRGPTKLEPIKLNKSALESKKTIPPIKLNMNETKANVSAT
jgi:hypothetical protein